MKRVLAGALVLAALTWGALLVVELRDRSKESWRDEQAAHPAAETVAMADEIGLTPQGRTLFYRSVPRYVGATEVMDACAAGNDRPGDSWAGCYDGSRITIYRPADPRLAGSTLVTAAHEFLHAVFDELDKADRDEVTALLAAEVKRLPAKARVRRQIAASTRRAKENLPSEQFAYLGTQVRRAGGLAPRLEEIYARYLTDRRALVESYRRSERVLTRVWKEVVAEEKAVAEDRSVLEGDKASYNSDRENLQREIDEALTLTPDELAGTTITLTRDGKVVLRESLADYLRTEGPRLQQVYDSFAGREAAVAERARIAAQRRADAEALTVDAQPGLAARSGSAG